MNALSHWTHTHFILGKLLSIMKENDRTITLFTMVGHATFHLYEMVIPLFVVIWLNEFDISAAVLGAVVAVGYGMIGVGALPSGSLADRYGSKRLVVLSMGGMAGGFALISVAPTIWVLSVALVLWGAAASLYHPAGLSLITRGTNQQGTALAYHGVAGNVGTAIGPLAAVLLFTVLDWRFVAGLLIVPALIGVLIASRLTFDERREISSKKDNAVANQPSGLRKFLERSKMLLVGGFIVAFAIAMLAGTYYRGVFTFLPEILADLPVFGSVEIAGEPIESSQYVYAGLLLIGGLGQYVGGKLSDYRSPEWAISGVFTTLILISLLFPFFADAGLVATLVICAALGFFVFMEAPIHQALIGKYTAADIHGLSFGYTYLGVFGLGAAGASIAGIVLTYGGTSLLFTTLAIFPVIGLILAGHLIIRNQERGEKVVP
ncbi:major facilitator superfamily protein [Natrialba aegyptia DSM 13077]|uniref:Major facilitator superfamily protein n=2 Tax=Halobacteriales TaxID=2235 RepID=M0ANB4_9EURY|nr:major facilitator superfamily protein [Natrialba aegyptia DSM 13077]